MATAKEVSLNVKDFGRTLTSLVQNGHKKKNKNRPKLLKIYECMSEKV